jgi:hypothetical protein
MDDIHAEVTALNPDRLWESWVEVDHFECRHAQFDNYKKRSFSQIVNEDLGNFLSQRADLIYQTRGRESMPRPRITLSEEEWNRFRWTVGSLGWIQEANASDPHGEYRRIQRSERTLEEDLKEALVDVAYEQQFSTRVLVEFADHTEVWRSASAPHLTNRSFVRSGDRYFRVHSGKRWFDFRTNEIDHIYTCQDFTLHDRFFTFGAFGRIFFDVQQRDRFEGTIFLCGIGGCGKSTILKAYQQFWPPHLHGIASSNLQTQFGMANLAVGRVAWCSEMSEDPNMPQEDWQDATGGATVLCPRKHKEPLTVERWRAQFVWAGNSFPVKYRNKHKQVSRRLYGTNMDKPVKPRRDDVLTNIRSDLGTLCRKSIVCYEEWLLQQGNVDPMSKINDLPPAYKSFYKRSCTLTDVFEAIFEDGGYVQAAEGERMPLSVFLDDIYRSFLPHFEGKPPRLSEKPYMPAFLERGIEVQKGTMEYNSVTYTNVDIISGLKDIRDADMYQI